MYNKTRMDNEIKQNNMIWHEYQTGFEDTQYVSKLPWPPLDHKHLTVNKETDFETESNLDVNT